MFSYFKKDKITSLLLSSYYPLKLKENITFNKKIYLDSLSYKEEFLDREEKFLGTYLSQVQDLKDKLLFESLDLEVFIFNFSNELFSREKLKFPSISLSTNFILETLEGEGYVLLEDKATRKEVKLYELKKFQRIEISKEYFCTIYSRSKSPLRLIGVKKKSEQFSFGVLKKSFGSSLFYTKEGFIKNKNLASSFHLNEFFSEHVVKKDLYKEVVENPDKYYQKVA